MRAMSSAWSLSHRPVVLAADTREGGCQAVGVTVGTQRWLCPTNRRKGVVTGCAMGVPGGCEEGRSLQRGVLLWLAVLLCCCSCC